MIQVNTIRNNTKTSANSYCFSSAADKVIEREELISSMVKYNSTLTEADAAAALAVIEETVNRLLEEGCKVKLPWVSLCFCARGTASTSGEEFRPGHNDNRFELRATPSRKTERKLSDSVKFKGKAGANVMCPKISLITCIDKTAQEKDELAAEAGGILRIRGEYLGFDVSDDKQGVFFEQKTGQTTKRLRAERYTRRTRNTIDVLIPESLAAGKYDIMLTTSSKTSGLRIEHWRKSLTVG